MGLSHAANARRKGAPIYRLQENDWYPTPPWPVRALAKHFYMQRTIWEPSAGSHSMANELRAQGAYVITSDIAAYDGVTHDHIYDFFAGGPPPFDASNQTQFPFDIVTNPPYGHCNALATRFARRALELCDGWIALLLTAKFDFGKSRTDLFRDNPRFWASIALMDRINWFDGKRKGFENHAWFIWAPKGNHIPADAKKRFWEQQE